MIFPTKRGEWRLDIQQLMVWQDLYPRLDVSGELNKAWVWLEANPTRRKTPFGMPRFLVNWLNKASMQQAVTSKVSYRPRATRDATCPHQPACPFPGNWQCQQRTVLEAARVRYR
jgi:hypothetical protein